MDADPAGIAAEQPLLPRLLRPTLYCLLILPLVACGDMDYSLKKNNFSRESRKSDTLAAVDFDQGVGQDPYSVQLNRARNQRGYALQAPVYDDHEGMKTHFTVSRTKEYRWFSGLQFSFNF